MLTQRKSTKPETKCWTKWRSHFTLVFWSSELARRRPYKSRSSICNKNPRKIVEWIRDLDWDMEPSLSRAPVRIRCGGCFWTRVGFCGSDGDHGDAAVATSLTRLFCFQTSRFSSWESCSRSELRETCSSEPENLQSKLQEQFGRQGIRKRGRRWCGKRGKCRWRQHRERGCAFAGGAGHGRGGERGRSQEETVAVAERGDTGWGAGGGESSQCCDARKVETFGDLGRQVFGPEMD